MKKFTMVAALAAFVCVAVTGNAAKTKFTLSGVAIPGIDAAGAPDDMTPGAVDVKGKFNDKNNKFVAKGKGTAPNASGNKATASGPIPASLVPSGIQNATGDFSAKYKKPKPDTSKVKVKAKGSAEVDPNPGT